MTSSLVQEFWVHRPGVPGPGERRALASPLHMHSLQRLPALTRVIMESDLSNLCMWPSGCNSLLKFPNILSTLDRQTVTAPVTAGVNQLEKLEAEKAACLVYLSLLCLTGPYWALLGPTGPYWAILGHSGPYWALLGLTRPYWALLSLIGPHLASLSLI